jgi:hypothetical protein
MEHVLTKRMQSQALEFFMGEDYRIPSREDLSYVSMLQSFMDKARQSLESILSEALRSLPVTLEEGDIMFYLDEHGDTTTNAYKLLTGQSGGVLTDEGILISRDLKRPTGRPVLIIASDQPRAKDHALHKYYTDDELSDLEPLRLAVPATLAQNRGLVSRDVQLSWIKYALEHGILPTPVLRAQFYGPMELLAESAKTEDINSSFAQYGKYLDSSPQQVKEALQYCRDALSRRKDAHESLMVEGIGQITETRMHVMNRVAMLFGMFKPGGKLYELAKGKDIQFVSHSGTNDVILEYLRHFAVPDEIHLERRPKQKQRGLTIPARLGFDELLMAGETKRVFVYMNNPGYFKDILDRSEHEANESYSHSLDDDVKEGKEVLTPRLIKQEVQRMRSRQDGKQEYKARQARLNELDKSGQIQLVLGNVGEGKTIFCAYLARRLLRGDGFSDNAQRSYIPVMIRLKNLNSQLHNEMKKGKKISGKLVSNIVFDSMMSCGPRSLELLLKEHRPVFILDGLDELDQSHARVVLEASKELYEKGPLILTSRYDGFDHNSNPGMATYNVDNRLMHDSLEEYLGARIKKGSLKEFIGFLQKVAPETRYNPLMLHSLTMLYEKNLIDIETPPSEFEINMKVIRMLVHDHTYQRGQDIDQEFRDKITKQTIWEASKIAFVLTMFPGVRLTKEDIMDRRYDSYLTQLNIKSD